MGTLALVGGQMLASCRLSVPPNLERARKLQASGNFVDSITPLKEVLSADPGRAEASYRLGIAYLNTGARGLAVSPLRDAMKSGTYRVSAGLLLAGDLLSTRHYRDAIKVTDRVLQFEPSQATALYIRAHANLAAGSPDQALADVDRLLKLKPNDPNGRALRASVLVALKRYDEAGNVLRRFEKDARASGNSGIHAQACVMLADFYGTKRADPKRAESVLSECLKGSPSDARIVHFAANFYDDQGEPQRATQIVRKAIAAAPENLALRVTLANRLSRQGDVAEAKRVLFDAATKLGSAEAWELVSNFELQQKHFPSAKKALDRALSLAHDPMQVDRLRLRKAELLVMTGDLDAAEKLARELRLRTYRSLLEGRILLARNQPASALEKLRQGLQNWPNNPVGRYLAGVASESLGDLPGALVEYQDAVRLEPAATDAALRAAQLYMEEGRYRQALAFGVSQITSHAYSGPTPYLVMIRASAALGKYEQARRWAQALAQHAGQKTTALLAVAEVARREQGLKAAVHALEEPKLDLTAPKNFEVLQAWAQYVGTLGQTERALRKVDEAIRRDPKSAALETLRGRLLVAGDRPTEARAAFERALAVRKNFAPALAGLAAAASKQGDRKQAIALYDRAAAESPADQEYAYRAAQLTLASGDKKGAEARLRSVVKKDPGLADACNDLAWLLANQGKDLDRALRLAERAARLDPKPQTYDTLGWVHLKRHDVDAAVQAFQKALDEGSNDPSVRYRLGLALEARNDTGGALRAFQAALAEGPFPEAKAARGRVAELEAKDKRGGP